MSRKRHAGRWVVESLPHAGNVRELTAPVEETSFDDEDQARLDCARREREMRRTVNPFAVGQGALALLTSLDAPVFHDWLLDAGIDPPAADDWAAWYTCRQPRWDALQRERFWEALDLLRFHRVRERPARRGYVVMEVGWIWCDEPPYYPYDTGPECDLPLEVFSDRAAAERRRRDLEQQRRQEWPAHTTFRWHGGYAQLDKAPLYRVVEVEWEEEL